MSLENKDQASQKSSSVAHKGATLEESNLTIALTNVIEMAEEYCMNNLVDSDRVIGDRSRDKVKELSGQIQNKSINSSYCSK